MPSQLIQEEARRKLPAVDGGMRGPLAFSLPAYIKSEYCKAKATQKMGKSRLVFGLQINCEHKSLPIKICPLPVHPPSQSYYPRSSCTCTPQLTTQSLFIERTHVSNTRSTRRIASNVEFTWSVGRESSSRRRHETCRAP
jgi:hypothetical protein